MQEYAVEFHHVSKIYRLQKKEKGSRETGQMFYALRDISFQIPKGEVTGILGTNGSGKSTLAAILSGITGVDEGEVIINGEQSLAAINTGLNQQLTGLENIELKGALLGLSPHHIKEITEGVAEFSELGEFLYQPVKKYSSGMKSRLGFSINLCLDPDIMIIDEALSVGDRAFANKCLERMTELKNESGKTIIFISHSLAQVESFCDRAIWIEGGELKEYGGIGEVCAHYSDYAEYLNGLKGKEKKAENARKFQARVIDGEKKESGLDRFLSLIQKN